MTDSRLNRIRRGRPLLLVLVAGLALGVASLTRPSEAGAQDWQTLTTRRQVTGERELRVRLEFGAGNLRVEPAGANELYRASIRYDAAHFEPITDYTGGILSLGMEGSRRNRRQIREGSQLTLGLGTSVPLDLELAFGAVEAELELGGLRIRSAEISTGASETRVKFSEPNPEELKELELRVGAASFHAVGLGNANARQIDFGGGVGEIVLDFSGEWRGDTNVTASMGVGSLVLIMPRGLGVRLKRDTFLVSFKPEGLIKRGDGYYSKGWDEARHRLTIEVKGAFGAVDIRWIDDDRGRRGRTD